MKSKEKSRREVKSSRGSGGTNAQRDIAAIISKSSPARRAYDSLGLKPTIADMQATHTPGMESAGRVVCGLMSSGVAGEKVEAIITNFRNNHPDVVDRLKSVSAIAINAE